MYHLICKFKKNTEEGNTNLTNWFWLFNGAS